MSSIRTKRIIKDFRDAVKAGLVDGRNGIYMRLQDDVIRAAIVGPDGTPYEGGFFFFDITIPLDYPNKPPHVKFGTLNPRVRFNPNLYTDGKVCLSLLGTWHGPAWTACCSISTVMLSIQALVLSENPLRNEPGFETASEERLLKYDLVVEYYTYSVAVCDMLQRAPTQFEVFHDELSIHVYNNFDKYIERIETLRKKIVENAYLYMDYSKGILEAGVYSMCVKLDFDLLLTKLISMKEKMDIAIAKPDKKNIAERCDSLSMLNSYELISHYATLLDIPLIKIDTDTECGAGKEEAIDFKKPLKSIKELLRDIETVTDPMI